MLDRRLIQNFDWVLLLLLLFLAGISILNLYSATYPIRDMGGGEIFTKQIYWFLIGFAVFLLMTTFNYYVLERLAYPVYFVAVALLILVLITGKVMSGSQRWLSLGPVSFQPSELAKIAIVLVMAKFFSDRGENREFRLRDLWQPLILTAVPCFLILKEPDLGTALFLGMISASTVLMAKVYWKSLIILVCSTLSVVPLVWFGLKEYQQKRILSFLSPGMDPLGSGYHVSQSKIAIGSGQFWGKGFLKGTQTRLHFLPEQHTDFAFSVLAEEWGMVGSVLLLLIYLFIILWGLNIAKSSKDRFGAMVAVGIVTIIFWQVVINVGMVTGLLPVVGIPLVLFSYGGSSLISTMAAMGILMNISMRRFMFQ
ncbi:MAG: rod shape-determining protein RodA [Deltaproteobacteria bacterium]|nr:rod shape-determining protein RodA [Deltaproteobacteria bacterium]MBW2046909.1 rod shape-determining protein RodA [Deltaproteobacteria bacterium]MBW2110954.1 rod shape-determining protein RodA [Deltaproteobacteria bacterium]MBW2351736.1 rod shape-determining protein RodA [Deltaproteobacteria bacterium]HDZ89570.1 rod shape-determining protein RodA [Deltaproteobacteria bacterium]